MFYNSKPIIFQIMLYEENYIDISISFFLKTLSFIAKLY
jgi:hypothetical protein